MKENGLILLILLGVGGWIGWSVYQKNLKPIGGVAGAIDLSGGFDKIVSGAQQLGKPFGNLLNSILSPQGAGSVPTPAPWVTGPPQMPLNNNGVPSWLGVMQSAVNTATGAYQLFRDAGPKQVR